MRTCRFFFLAILWSFTLSPYNLWSQDNQKVYQSNEVESVPEFPGGGNAKMEFIHDRLVYPEPLLREEIDLRFEVQFIVDEKGQTSHFEFLNRENGVEFQIPEEMKTEALRVLKTMPKWQPALKDETPVKCYTQTLIFFYFEPVPDQVDLWLFFTLHPAYVDSTRTFKLKGRASKSDYIYSVDDVDVLPKYFGSKKAVFYWLSEMTYYPEEEFKKELTQRFTIRLVVEKDGSLSGIQCLSKECNEQLIASSKKAMLGMLEWDPAIKNNLRVRCYYDIIFNFNPRIFPPWNEVRARYDHLFENDEDEFNPPIYID